MRSCSGARVTWKRAGPLTSIARRCKSYDQARYNEEYWLGKVQEGLGNRPDSPRVDSTTNSVRTAAGDLPLSPVFDPKWISNKTRKTKAKKAAASGRFQSKVYNNIYARALETPLRHCAASRTLLPRFFLQDFEVVTHPTTGKPWWAPGPLSFSHIENDKFAASSDMRLHVNPETGERSWVTPSLDDLLEATAGPELDSTEARNDEPLKEATQRIDTPSDPSIPPISQVSGETLDDSTRSPVSKPWASGQGLQPRAPIVAYTAGRKSILDSFKAGKAPLNGGRSGLAIDATFQTTYWRSDMSDFLLAMYRRYITDALIRRATRPEGKDPFFYIEPCKNWETVQNVRSRGAVLWLPGSESGVRDGAYQTLDVDAKYGMKLTVYNLPWLLGEKELKRLKEEAPTFRMQEIFVLSAWATWAMKNLHMLLWRLQGYLVGQQESP